VPPQSKCGLAATKAKQRTGEWAASVRSGRPASASDQSWTTPATSVEWNPFWMANENDENEASKEQRVENEVRTGEKIETSTQRVNE
jgi:hypothetical protein